MSSEPDLYACLNIPPMATVDEIRQAYRLAARRFHPDANSDAWAMEEFKRVAQAHDILSDAKRRAEYDSQLPTSAPPLFQIDVLGSRSKIRRQADPQIVYCLLNIKSALPPNAAKPPLNLCMVVDRSTSMQGVRLNQVKAAAQQIVERLKPHDIFSLVAFSDKPEVVIPAQTASNKAAAISKVSTIQAGGGTEILPGLLCGLLEVQRNASPLAVNQVFLLTDGRTYGDEEDCLLLAMMAEGDGICISALGIGDEWNDSFLDRLAVTTGGHSEYVRSPEAVTRLLGEQMRSMGGTAAQHIQLNVICDPWVSLRSALRVRPETQLLPLDSQPLKLGHLQRNEPLCLLLEFVVADVGDDDVKYLARLRLSGDLPDADRAGAQGSLDLALPASDAVEVETPPLEIANALDKLTLYRLQEKAWAAVDNGNIALATMRLQTFATRLLATGEAELAVLALAEADRLGKSQQISAEGRKRIKYGTRALIAPPQ